MRHDNTAPARIEWASAATLTVSRDSGQDKMKRYEKSADETVELIRIGVPAPGQKMPSVWHASRAYGVGALTMFRAYYLLESRGLIMARARPGYLTCQHVQWPPPEPGISPHQAGATEADVSELVLSVLSLIKDPDTVPFGSAFPSLQLLSLPCLARSMAYVVCDMDPQSVVVDMTPGNYGLHRQIALCYMVGSLLLSTEELVISNSALEVFNLCSQVVTRLGDLVAIETSAFYTILQVLEQLRLKVVETPVHPREDIDSEVFADSLERLLIKACRFVSNFQNPMDASMDDEKKRALVELLVRHQALMIEDDVYAELYLGRQAPRPVKAYDQEGPAMHCSSFSKSPAPGYRVGWVAGGRHVEQIERLKLTTSLLAPTPAQVAIADYLQHGGYNRHLRKLRYALKIQQNAMLAAVMRYFPEQTRVSRPSGGCFLWPESPEAADSLRLFQLALAQGISSAPGSIFSATRRFTHCARLNYGYPWSMRQGKAMETLGRIAQSLAG